MLFSNSYLSISEPATALIKEKGSKFYAFAFPVKTETEFKNKYLEIKNKYPDATHHCFALVLNPDKSFQKSSDDGEPANTGGKPILRAILANNLTNIGIVVVRYFGGTMLGVPGLINSYNLSAMEAIKSSIKIEIIIELFYEINGDFKYESDMHRFVKKLEAKLINTEYTDDKILIRFSLPRSKANRINELREEFYFLNIIEKEN